MFGKRNCGCGYKQNTNDDLNTINNNNMEVIEYSYNQNYTNSNMNCNCGYTRDNAFPDNYMYGNSYVPNFVMSEVFTPDVGLKTGTVFPELVSPYIPNQSTEIIEYLKSANEIGEGCNNYGM